MVLRERGCKYVHRSNQIPNGVDHLVVVKIIFKCRVPYRVENLMTALSILVSPEWICHTEYARNTV
jgi:hypothetical protein